MPRKVIMPTEVSKKLDNLIFLEQDVRGILFYRQLHDYCPIESMFITGMSSESSEKYAKERMEVANIFLEMNRGYEFVKFQTHSKGTIAKFGEYLAQNFSSKDLVEINKNIELNKYCMFLLVTPKIKLIKGHDAPQLFGGNYPEYEELNKENLQKLDDIANSLGYDLSMLGARLK